MSRLSSASQHTEPHFSGAAAVPLRAPPLRPAPRPAAGELRQPPRFAADPQPADAGRIVLTAPERLAVSSQIGETTGPSRGVLRLLSFLVLLGLAAVGAVTLLHNTFGVLPL